MFFVFDSIPDEYQTQKICEIVFFLYPFLIVYCLDIYVILKMRDEAVDVSPAAFNCISN